jgi:hypothetical protein
MSALRSLPENIEYRIRLKHASEFNYAIAEHSRKDVEGGNYFHNISRQHGLAVADKIFTHILHMDGTSSSCIFQIVAVDHDHTVTKMIEPWVSVGGKHGNSKVPKEKPLQRVA